MLSMKVSYKESIGVRADRIAPTIGDLARLRDFKGLKDLIHKPKTTMILDHAPHAVEILKLGGLNYAEFKNFVHTVEDLFFQLSTSRSNKYASYTKDELNIDVLDEYCADIDRGKRTRVCNLIFTVRAVATDVFFTGVFICLLARSLTNVSIHMGQWDRGDTSPPIFGLGDIITNVPLNISRVISARRWMKFCTNIYCETARTRLNFKIIGQKSRSFVC